MGKAAGHLAVMRQPVAMGQLLTHTAGLEETSKDIIFYDPGHLKSLGTYCKQQTPARVYPPGTTPAYFNLSTALAGYVVERVPGRLLDGDHLALSVNH